MASVVLTQQQIAQIATHFAQTQFGTPNQTAVAALDQIQSAVSTLAMSISIGAGSVSFSPAFTPPISNMSATAQAVLICYIIQVAMGVPLVG